MFKVFYFCSREYKTKVESFISLWQSGIEVLEVQTSGSTGVPKIIPIKRNQFLASVQFTKEHFGLNSSFKSLSNLHIDYIAGKLMLIRAMEIGFEIDVVEPVSNPFLNLPSNKIYDLLSFVPLQIESIYDNISTKEKLNQAKIIIVGGTVVNSNLNQKLQSISCPVYATYGMTETVTHVAKKLLNTQNKSIYFEVFDTIEIKKNTYNCLQIKSKTTDNQWIETNDIIEIYKFNNKIHFELIGRKDNIINSGGVKIQLEKVESILSKFLKIRFFCWGLVDEKLGQKLVLFIEQKENYSSLIQFSNEKLTKFEVPKEIFSIEKFIETPSGKIDKIKTVNAYFQNSISNF